MRYLKASLWVITGLLLMSCGYHFSLEEAQPHRTRPSVAIKTIAILPFNNKTQCHGLENVLQNELVYEFTTGQGPKLVSKDQAEAILTGVIFNYQETGISYTHQKYASSGKVSLTIRAILKDKNGKILWENPNLYDQENFRFGQTPNQTQSNKKEAIRRLLRRMAERIYENLTTNR